MNADELLRHYERIADAPEAVARLRRFILDLAVRGKLVPSDPKEAPAYELLRDLAAAKSKQLGIGRTTRHIESPKIAGDELPFTAPPHWAWLRLRDIGRLSGGMTPAMSRSDYWGGDVVWISPKDVKSDELSNSELKITLKGLSETRLEAYPPGSLFVVARSGILKRAFPVAINRVPAAANQDMKVLVPFVQRMERYLQIMLRGLTEFVLKTLVKTGTTVQSLKYAEFETQPFPLPPLAEQHRIVAKVDELMALCDRLEAARARREAARDRLARSCLARLDTPDPETFREDARFALDALPALTARPDQIKQLRQTILNLAVRGRLVQQDPSDESASRLLARIASERVSVTGTHHLRNERLEPKGPAKPPFDVPQAWIWSRIGDAVLSTQYGTSRKAHPSADGVAVLTMGNIQDGLVVWGNEKKIPHYSEELPELLLRKFDLLYNRTNSAELVGKTGIYFGEEAPRTFASYLIRLRPSHVSTDARFINFAMNAPYFRTTQILPLVKKQTGQANVNGTALKNMLIPLPPLAEQHRIVAKVDELMVLCDHLEASLKQADEHRRRLLEALLHQALEPAAALEEQAA